MLPMTKDNLEILSRGRVCSVGNLAVRYLLLEIDSVGTEAETFR